MPRRTFWRIAISVAAVFGLLSPALAGVKVTISQNAHKVPGTTAKALVMYMQSNPVRGDHGGAFANIRPRYTLSITTKDQKKGGICRAKKVDVNIHFTLTLPEATNIKGMSKKVRTAWNSFIGFARSHENQHKHSYIGCAERFIAQALKQSAESCGALEMNIRRMFDESKRKCEQRQSAFDRQQKGVLLRQSLIRMAGF
jgi:predicted secreted Zn-dependent protease